MADKAVILDFDDTIMATFEQRSELIIRVAKEFGYLIDLERIRKNWGKPFFQLITSIMPGVDFSAFLDVYSKAMETTKPKLHLGAENLLNHLKEHNILAVIVSSSSRDLIIQDLKAVELVNYVDSVWGYEDTDFHKPDPRSLEKVIQYLEMKAIYKQNCISIGDSPNDYLTAYGNKLPFLCVTTGQDGYNDFITVGLSSENIFPSLPSLMESSLFGSFMENH